MKIIIDYAIALKEAGFSFGDILTIVMLAYVLKNNLAVTTKIASGITTLIYQNKNKYLDDEETEKFIDKIFSDHINKKWIFLCDLMDENGFSSEIRREQVRSQISLQFDTFTSQEREDLDEYLTAWGSKIGTRFFAMYMEIKDLYLSKVYEIIFSDNKRSIKKREFFNLCQNELVKIKSKLRK